MTALDGNALGGVLIETFGLELTNARGVCASCGARAYVAEAMVYLDGPGAVARCRTCASVLMVLVTIRGITCVDLSGLESLTPEPSR
jgi:Family of unknown function (DUF6510)